MKKLFVVLLVLSAVATGAFAQNVFTSYNAPGNVNVYASVGYYWFPEVSVAAEFVLGKFAIGPMPLDWGIAVRGGMDFWAGGIDYAVGALATLHTGLAVFPLEFYASLGACLLWPGRGIPRHDRELRRPDVVVQQEARSAGGERLPWLVLLGSRPRAEALASIRGHESAAPGNRGRFALSTAAQ